MITRITHVTLLVRDQDEALRFYTEKLGFEVATDMSMPDCGMRWLTVRPKGQTGLELTLMPADTPEKQAAVGKQAGGHLLFVVATDDCQKEYERLKAAGVKVAAPPKEQPWGIETQFEDLYGNGFDLLQPAHMG